MDEATKSESNKSSKKQNRNKKHKLQEEPDQEKDVEQQQPATKLRKPQAPAKKSRKRVKKAERHQKERQEAFDRHKSSVATYLESWKNDKSSWKFNKKMQNWILSNLYDSELLPYSLWPIALEYFVGSIGSVKTNITETATKIVEGADSETNKVKLCRAKEIIQAIVE